MELTQDQYNFIKPSIDRYRLSIEHKVRVYNDTDKIKALELITTLGLDFNKVSCESCDFIEVAKSYFKELNNLVEKYENVNTSVI